LLLCYSLSFYWDNFLAGLGIIDPEKSLKLPDQLDSKLGELRPDGARVKQDGRRWMAGEDLASWEIGKRPVIKSRPMFARLISRKAMSCWLLAALLLQSLMPAMAGLRTGDGTRWAEVCVSSGIKWVPISDASESQFSHAAADHCVLCAATGAAPEFDVTAYLSDSATDSPSFRRDRTPVLTFSAFQRQSRAPPR
jgi:hypothetical protein